MFNKRKLRKMKDMHDTASRDVSLQNGSREHTFSGERTVDSHAVAQSFSTPYISRFVSDQEAPQWDDLEEISAGVRGSIAGQVPLVDFHRDTPVSRAFDLLRTRLRQTVRAHGWKNIAVTAPSAGCGNTFTAVNLALSLSRVQSTRTVLMDFNMRDPGVADAFDMEGRGDIAEYLTGSTPMMRQMCRISPTLALGLNSRTESNAAEVLQDPATQQTLERMRAALRPDLIIYDMPPLLAHDDVSAFLPQLDGVLLVSDGTQTQAKHLKECERILEGQVPLLGVILNRARASSIEPLS